VLKNLYAWTIVTKQNTNKPTNYNYNFTFNDKNFISCLKDNNNIFDLNWNNIQLPLINN